MSKEDSHTDGPSDGHASSMEWLIASIDVGLDKGLPSHNDTDDETPNEILQRRLTGVEPRWWASVLLFTAIWLALLNLFGFIADKMSPWPRLRFGALLGFLVAVVYVSREFGARFRALNDRSSHAHETTWAMLSGWLLISLVSVISEPMKKLAADVGRYDTMTSVALVSWIYLYNAALKLPWDKATEQRKSAHSHWLLSLKGLMSSLRAMPRRSLQAALAPGDISLNQHYHRQLAEWDATYPGWRASWRQRHTAGEIARYADRM